MVDPWACFGDSDGEAEKISKLKDEKEKGEPACDDPWACFSGDDAPPAIVPAKRRKNIQLAADNWQFAWLASLWPDAETREAMQDDPLGSSCSPMPKLVCDMKEQGESVCKELVAQGYCGKKAAEQLNILLTESAKPETPERGRDILAKAVTCDEFCASELEQTGKWGAPCWHLATAWSLGIMLFNSIKNNTTENKDWTKPAPRTGGGVEALFYRLLELVVYSGRHLEFHAGDHGERRATSWAGAMLLAAEIIIGKSARRKGTVKTLVTPNIPTCLPHGNIVNVPSIETRRQIQVREHEKDITPIDFANNFLGKANRAGIPVVIKNYVNQKWDCARLSDLNELNMKYGERLVPVTFGSILVGSDFEKGVVPLRVLIENYLEESNRAHEDIKLDTGEDTSASDPEVERILPKTAYMSQHQLFHQCPELLNCITVPTYTMGRELAPANAWIGTRGTVTTLHSDAGENLLCQVAGYKYVRLYGLDQTEKLYAHHLRPGTKNVFGTSDVRVEKPDLAKHPNFKDAEYTETILRPGDMLYIPDGHWHYIRSLTTSISVNFW